MSGLRLGVGEISAILTRTGGILFVGAVALAIVLLIGKAEQVYWLGLAVLTVGLVLILVSADLANRLLSGEAVAFVGHWGGFGGGLGGGKVTLAAMEFLAVIVLSSGIFSAAVFQFGSGSGQDDDNDQKAMEQMVREAAEAGVKSGAASALEELVLSDKEIERVSKVLAKDLIEDLPNWVRDTCALAQCLDRSDDGPKTSDSPDWEELTGKIAEGISEKLQDKAAKDLSSAAESGAESGAKSGAQTGVEGEFEVRKGAFAEEIGERIAATVVREVRHYIDKELLESTRNAAAGGAQRGVESAIDSGLEARLARRVAFDVVSMIGAEEWERLMSLAEIVALIRDIGAQMGAEVASAIREVLGGADPTRLPPHVKYLQMYFEFAGDQVSSPDLEILRKTIEGFEERGRLIHSVLIVSSADTRGTLDYNRELANRRAEEVRWLIENEVYEVYGERSPPANNIQFFTAPLAELAQRRLTSDDTKDPFNRIADVFFILEIEAHPEQQ